MTSFLSNGKKKCLSSRAILFKRAYEKKTRSNDERLVTHVMCKPSDIFEYMSCMIHNRNDEECSRLNLIVNMQFINERSENCM